MKNSNAFDDMIATRTEIEAIDTFAMTDDRRKFIIMGQKFHYVFDMPSGLDGMLTPPFEAMAEARLPLLYVDGDRASGILRLSFPSKVARPRTDILSELGFSPNGIGDWVLKERLSGQRYNAEGFNRGKLFRQHTSARYIMVQCAPSLNGSSPPLARTPCRIEDDGSVALDASSLVLIGERMLAILTH
jgi:hypothetical protein